MKQSEKQFLEELESHTAEQRKLFDTVITPHWLRWLAAFLSQNPWRVILPVSVFLYLILWTMFGNAWPTWVLALFGKNP